MKRFSLNLLFAISCIFMQSSGGCAEAGASPIFRESFQLSIGTYWCEQGRMTVADMDGDGRKDIVMMQTSLASPVGPPWSYKARVTLLRGQADGGFVASTVAEFPGAYGYNITAGDLDNDGAVDFVVSASQGTHVFVNDREGGFRRVGTAPSGYYIGPLMDVNRDGLLDIVSGSQTGQGGVVTSAANSGDGVFQAAWQSRLYGSGYDSVETVLRLNLDGDGIPDLAAREFYGGRLITFMGTTNATAPFAENRVMEMGERTFALVGGRLNGDSVDDVAAYVGWGQVRVFMNQGSGTLTNYWTSPSLGEAAFNLGLGDFDGDGANDILVGTFGTSATRMGTLRIYRNIPGNGFEEWWQQPLDGPCYVGAVADLNDDGTPDLIVGEKHCLRILVNQTGRPQITRLEPLPKGARIAWSSKPGKTYRVQRRTWWSDGTWEDLPAAVTAISTTSSIADEAIPSDAYQRFYRVMELP